MFVLFKIVTNVKQILKNVRSVKLVQFFIFHQEDVWNHPYNIALVSVNHKKAYNAGIVNRDIKLIILYGINVKEYVKILIV